MNIQTTVVQREIDAIINSGSKPVVCRWDVRVHANGRDYEPLFVMNVECESNFIENYADVLSVEIAVLEGDLNYLIIPYKSALEVTVRRIPLTDGVMPVVDDYNSVEAFRYTATLYDNQSGILEGNTPNLNDQQTANRGSYVPVRLQLVHPVLEQLRMQTVGGIFRNMTALDLVVYLLTKYSKTNVRESSLTVRGVTVLSQSTGVVRKHISLPHLTPVINAPDVIHRKHGGIFAAGFHYYLQRQHWYLYAPYDVQAYARSKRSLTIITVPANRFPSPERSYRETPTQLFIMATGDSKHIDDSEQQQLNEGNGVRFIDASKVFDDWGKVDNNRLTVTRADNVNEILAESRPNKLNYVKESSQRITTNYMQQYSALARRSGSFIQHVWENANPDLLYPGMPVKLMYLQNNTAEELYGTLVGVHSFSTAETKGMVNKRFIDNATLTVFINRHIKLS